MEKPVGCGGGGHDREVEVAPAKVAAEPDKLERLVAGHPLADKAEQGLADLELDGCYRLLRGDESPDLPAGEPCCLLDSCSARRTDRVAFVRPGDQPFDLRGAFTSPRLQRLGCLDSHARLASVVRATNCKRANRGEWTTRRPSTAPAQPSPPPDRLRLDLLASPSVACRV